MQAAADAAASGMVSVVGVGTVGSVGSVDWKPFREVISTEEKQGNYRIGWFCLCGCSSWVTMWNPDGVATVKGWKNRWMLTCEMFSNGDDRCIFWWWWSLVWFVMKEKIFGVSTVNDIGSLMMTVVVTAASFKTWLLKNLLLDQLFNRPYFPPVPYREMKTSEKACPRSIFHYNSSITLCEFLMTRVNIFSREMSVTCP